MSKKKVKGAINWKYHLLLLFIIQTTLFFYSRLIKANYLSIYLMVLFIFLFPFITKKFYLKFSYTLIAIFSVPIVFLSLFQKRSDIIYDLLIIIFVGLINSAINYFIHLIYDSYLHNKLTRKIKSKIRQGIAIVSISFLIIYTILAPLSTDCVQPDMPLFQDYKDVIVKDYPFLCSYLLMEHALANV